MSLVDRQVGRILTPTKQGRDGAEDILASTKQEKERILDVAPLLSQQRRGSAQSSRLALACIDQWSYCLATGLKVTRMPGLPSKDAPTRVTDPNNWKRLDKPSSLCCRASSCRFIRPRQFLFCNFGAPKTGTESLPRSWSRGALARGFVPWQHAGCRTNRLSHGECIRVRVVPADQGLGLSLERCVLTPESRFAHRPKPSECLIARRVQLPYGRAGRLQQLAFPKRDGQ